MRLTAMHLVTVITTDDLEDRVVRELTDLGATGYTIVPARGSGSHGQRTSELEGGNIHVEVIVDRPTADRIVERLLELFQPRHALVVYVTAIEVVRVDKFAPPPPPPPSPPSPPRP